MTPIKRFQSRYVVKLTPNEMATIGTSCQYAVIDTAEDPSLKLSNMVAAFFTEKGAVYYCETH